MIKLSASKLSSFFQCKRCFYLEKREGIKKPSGVFSALPSGMDLYFKKRYDHFRAKGELPPEVRRQILGLEPYTNQAQLKKWRYWKNDLSVIKEKFTLSGAVDDLLVQGKYFTPFDYKTKGFEPKTSGAEYYQLQLDCFDLMLREAGFKTSGSGILVYYWPVIDSEILEPGRDPNSAGIVFDCRTYELEANGDRAENIINEVVETLERDQPPDSSTACDYCAFYIKRGEYEKLR